MPAQHQPNAAMKETISSAPKTAAPELKPCPFCGCEPELHECSAGPINESGLPETGWFIRCLCDSGDICVETVWHPTIESVSAAWNRRV